MRSSNQTSLVLVFRDSHRNDGAGRFQKVWDLCVALLVVATFLSFWPRASQGASDFATSERVGQGADVTKGALQPSPSPETYSLDTGDYLQIRFYDRYDRDDLNGVYVVGESGQLRLPRIGSFSVRKKTVAQLERDIREAVENRGEKLGYFSVDVSRCRPFYIVGPVHSPGAYPFSPGLTVLHAISLAGGFYRSPAGEKISLTDTLSRQAALVARLARLQAESDGSQVIHMPDELVQLDPSRASEMIMRERNILEQSRQVIGREKAMIEKLVALSQSEVENYNRDAVRIEQRIVEQARTYAQLKKLHEEKVINQQRFFEAVTALDSLQRDKQTARASLTQANSTLERAQRDLAMLKLSESARIAKEISETEIELSRLRKIVAQTRELAHGLDGASVRNGLGTTAEYKIVRRNDAGRAETMQAGETTLIMPGDIVKIEARAESEGSF